MGEGGRDGKVDKLMLKHLEFFSDLPLKILNTIKATRRGYKFLAPLALGAIAVVTYTVLLHPTLDLDLVSTPFVHNASMAHNVSEGLTAFALRKALPPSDELDAMIANGEYMDLRYLIFVTVLGPPGVQVISSKVPLGPLVCWQSLQ